MLPAAFTAVDPDTTKVTVLPETVVNSGCVVISAEAESNLNALTPSSSKLVPVKSAPKIKNSEGFKPS